MGRKKYENKKVIEIEITKKLFFNFLMSPCNVRLNGTEG